MKQSRELIFPSPGIQPISRVPIAGFTILEVLVSTLVLVFLVVLLAGITDRLSDIWKRTTGSITQWQSARSGFEAMNRRISQATLNTTWAYYDGPNGTGNLTTSNPKSYGRSSALHFISGPASILMSSVPDTTSQAIFFQAPLGRTTDASVRGLPQILNACGYFVQFNDSVSFRPPGALLQSIPGRKRFRLMEWTQDSSELTVQSSTGNTWFQNSNSQARPMAENVIALIIRAKFSRFDTTDENLLAPEYRYDSRESRAFSGGGISGNTLHQLPPVLQLTMVAIDERSAARLEQQNGGAFPTGLFAGAPFMLASEYKKNMETLEANLVAARLDYRVFSATILIRGAKWSGD